ncbi:Anr2p KNAG_0A07190 [Huiozyma naganishii CBS 8797]|uniref:DUF4484 domain-containing protein n=1 Tax=Huiozyma naganishii (strain ATCC MYA-139 / BCRC 22969 / CBS 8797 / KCTC 17520 / NBRC 10181 / NCYC 3082 / Yp74L-3) TaxID=1071383 RepID=J7RU73_HUIN7|nr:hypothetical protein KNAG_0A07190 [Kazachstania naganishii CBS 8797]CCK68372.1 hypothetical protein KNAG_0A07190 [Kazachstania naganishii CBS 8797]
MTNSKPVVPLRGVFLSKFDMRRGNVVEWSVDCSPFASLEFKSMPSGIHDVTDDSISFVAKDNTEGKYYLGVAFYKQNGFDIMADGKQLDRSKVHMYSLGVILDVEYDSERGTKQGPFTEYGHYYINKLESLLNAWFTANDVKNTDSFKDFYESHARDKDITTLELGVESQIPMIHYLYHWIKRLGPLIFTLWKSCLLNERILILNPSGDRIGTVNALCYCLSLISQSCKLGSKTKSPLLLYTIGTADLENMKSILQAKRGRGYIACTSDELLPYKHEIYDKVLRVNSIWIDDEEDELNCDVVDESKKLKILDNKGKQIRATPYELELYELMLNTVLREGITNLDRFKYQLLVEPVSWYQYLVDTAYFFGTVGYVQPFFHITADNVCLPDTSVDVDDFNANADVLLAKSVQGYFYDKTAHIYNTLQSIIATQSVDPAIGDGVVILPQEMKELTLDCFSAQDYEFIAEIGKKWFDKEIVVNGGADYLKLAC